MTTLTIRLVRISLAIFILPLLLYGSSNSAHAQFAPRLPNTTYVFTPIKDVDIIEGYTSQQLTEAGCYSAEAVEKANDSRGKVLNLLPSDKVFAPKKENATSTTTNDTYYICSLAASQKILYGTIVSPNSFTGIFIDLIIGIFWFIDRVNTIILNWSGKLLMTMLSQGTFIQNALVRAAWPFVQGVANLGFIFALLYIALATTLRLESVSTTVQRLLPKLLIGALLVNFSLVIGGLLIDASRLIMAVEIQVVGGGEVAVDNLSAKLLEQAKLYENVERALTVTVNAVHGVEVPTQSSGWNSLVVAMTRSFFIFATAVAMAVLAIGLFWRYIMLLILLIVSPMAYLAVALPQTKHIVTQWWGNFIKWVMYGPIMLFFLIIIIRVQSADIASVPEEGILNAAFFQNIVKFIIVIALFFVANTMAKKISGIGSDTVMGFAKKHPRAALIGASVATGGLLGGAAAVGVGAGAGAAVLTSRSARDAYKRVGSNTLAGVKEIPGIGKVVKAVIPAKRDAKGNLLPGQSSLGSKLGGITDRLNPGIQRDISGVRNNAINPTTGLIRPREIDPATGLVRPGIGVDNVALTPSKLQEGHVVAALGRNDSERKTNITTIINTGSQGQRMALAKNKDYIAGLKPSDMTELQQTIQQAPYVAAKKAEKDNKGNITPAVEESGVSDRDKAQIIDQILKTAEEIKK